MLKQAAEVAGRIDQSDGKAEALRTLAQVAAELGDRSQAAELLKQAAEVAVWIDQPDNVKANAKAEVLGKVAQATAKLRYWRQARNYAERNTTDEARAKALIGILQVWHGTDEKFAEKENGF